MRITLDKTVFQEAFNAVRLKGKWFTATGLKSESLGNLVKIVAKPDEPKRGYHFINANNQTFVDYWIPFEVENESWAVIDITKAEKYLKNMGDEVTLILGNGAMFTGDRKCAEFPTFHLHSSDNACDSFFRASAKVVAELNEIVWGEFPIKSGFIIPTEVFSQTMKSCETVGHGIYKLELIGGNLIITADSGTSEKYTETIEPMASWGEDATVEYTGPMHSAFKKGLVQCHFNDDSLIVMQNENILVARAPYVVV